MTVSTPDPLVPALQSALGSAYTIRRELGGGGMSRVFVAEDHRLRRDVVVKVFPPSLAQSMLVDRFRREIMFAAGLQHPNVVPVLASGEADGLPYYVMPFIAGESLRVRLQRGPLSVRETASVMRDVARALAHAHGRGLVHRDIKPGNILLTANSASVADFGVAKALAAATQHSDGSTAVTMTGVGSSLGTPAYMAPEQVSADPAIDHRADLYALGIVTFEMLTGAPPFAGRSVRATMAAHLTETAPRVDTRRYDVPPALADLIATLLEKDPDKRPRNADAVIRALDDTSFGMESRTTAAAGLARRSRTPRRRWMLAAAAVALVLFAASLLAVYGRRSAIAAAARGPVTVVVAAPELFSTGPQARAFGIGLPAEIAARLATSDSVEVLTAAAPPRAAVDGAAPPRFRFESVVQDESAPAPPARPRLHAVLRLVDDRSGRVLWAESVSFAADSATTVQDRLAFEVTSAVRRHGRLP